MYGEYDEETLEKLHRAELLMLKDFQDICRRHDIRYFAIAGTAIGAVRHQGFIPWDDDIDVAMLREEYEKFVAVAEQEFAENYDGKYEMMGPEFPRKYYNLQPAMMRKDTKFVTDTAWAAGMEPGLFLDLFVYDSIANYKRDMLRQVRICKLYNMLYLSRNIHFLKLISKEKKFSDRLKYLVSGVAGCVLRCIPHGDAWIYKKFKKHATKYNGKTHVYSALCDPGASYMYVRETEMYPMVEMPFEDTTISMVREYKTQLARHMGKDFMKLPPESKRTNHFPRELDLGDMSDTVC